MLYCKYIKFYNESSWQELKIEKIIACLKQIIRNNVIENEKNFILYLNSFEKEKNLAFYEQAIVHDLKQPLYIYDLDDSTYSYQEKNFITDNKKMEYIDCLLYDGFIMQNLIRKLIKNPEHELTLTKLHIIITDKLLCTFDESDWRYHARSLICGNPTLISTSGIEEGLAKPRDYYYKLYFFREVDNIVEELKKEYNGQLINYNDPRINDIVEGLVLQSLFYFINSGDPFCDDKNCRFFNAHYQDDAIRINIKTKKICHKHTILLNKYNQSLLVKNNSNSKHVIK